MKRMAGEKLYAHVFRQIRALIIQNNLQPGDLLPTEQQLCETLGVSRNVLREAIKSMELMGLVSAQPGRGTTLQPFNLDFVFQNIIFASVNEAEKTIKEMLDIRKKLELGYLRQAYQSLEEADVVELRQLFNSIKTRWQKKEVIHDDDRTFHMLLFRNLNNTTLQSMLDAIWSVDENFKVDVKIKHMDEEIIQKHEAIVHALETRNYELFEASMIAHFATGKYQVNQQYSDF